MPTRILAVLSLFASLIFAQDARHIDFTQVLNGPDGKPIINADKSPMTLSDAAFTALENALEEDRQSTGELKFKLDNLTRKILHNKDAVLKVEEITLIKSRIGKVQWNFFGVVGAAWRILDPAEKSEEKK